ILIFLLLLLLLLSPRTSPVPSVPSVVLFPLPRTHHESPSRLSHHVEPRPESRSLADRGARKPPSPPAAELLPPGRQVARRRRPRAGRGDVRPRQPDAA